MNALHQLETTRETAWLGVLETLLPWLGSVTRLAEEAEEVAAIDLADAQFLRWHESPVQMGWAAPRAFIVFSLYKYSPREMPANIGRRTFLRHGMAVEIEQILDSVAGRDELWQLLGGRPADLADRVNALRSAIRASGALV